MSSLPTLLRTSTEFKFANFTCCFRWPAIVRSVVTDNADWLTLPMREQLDTLATACTDGTAIGQLTAAPCSACPQFSYWNDLRTKYSESTFNNIDWFVGEAYLYHLILSASGFYLTSSPGYQRDVFRVSKEKELAKPEMWQMIASFLECSQRLEPVAALRMLLGCCVWGNKADLSYTAVNYNQHLLREKEREELEEGEQSKMMSCNKWVVDESSAVVSHIQTLQTQTRPVCVHIIHDNVGAELLCDLLLVSHLFLLFTDNNNNNNNNNYSRASKARAAGQSSMKIVLHVKGAPTFVSDATQADILRHLHLMQHNPLDSAPLTTLACDLHTALTQGMLEIKEHAFWNSASFFDVLPVDLREKLSHSLGADLVVVKGDANYRRMVGDRLWAPSMSLLDPRVAPAASFPAPFVLLRTCKSDTVVGLVEDRAQQLDQEDGEWRVNGKWGMVQFGLPCSPPAEKKY